MLIAFSVAPAGVVASDTPSDTSSDAPSDVASDTRSDSVGDAVAQAVRVVRESGLPHETTAMFTTIEASTWEEGMDVVRRAVAAVQAVAPRVSLVLKADIRDGHETGQLQAKVDRIEEALRRPDRGADRH